MNASSLLDEYRARLRALRRRRSLRGGENPYLELMTLLVGAPAGLSRALDLAERRRELASLFSWAIPNARALEVLAAHAPLVECGAGMGYWSALLRARGVDVLAYDAAPPGRSSKNGYHRAAHEPWTKIRMQTSAAAARRHRERTLVLCWPPYDDDAASYAVLRAYRGGTLIYIGEPDEGATGSVRFHRELRLNWTLGSTVDLPRWPRLRDTLMVYRRNAERRPHVERDRCFECRRFIPTGNIGRCDWCFEHRPAALALQVGKHRVEYLQEMLDAMRPVRRGAVERSPNRIK
jgi:hypothetical protein